MDVAIADDDSIKRRYFVLQIRLKYPNNCFVSFSFAKEAMLNINAFFEFKQRTRYTYSFQLSQLLYHAQHLADYYTLPQIIGTDSSNRRTSVSVMDESVSTFVR